MHSSASASASAGPLYSFVVMLTCCCAAFPGWRPAFRYYNRWVSLLGFMICLLVMFFIQWLMALACVLIVGTAFMYIKHVKPGQCCPCPSSLSFSLFQVLSFNSCIPNYDVVSMFRVLCALSL